MLLVGECKVIKGHRTTAETVVSTLVPVVGEWEEALIADSILAVMDSLITFRRRYQQGSRIVALLDLLFQDESNPRSLAFQLLRVTELVAAFPRSAEAVRNLSHTEKLALEALTEVRLADPDQLAELQADPSLIDRAVDEITREHLNDRDRAAEQLHRVLSINPQNEEALARYGDHFRERRDWRGLADLLEFALECLDLFEKPLA